MFHIIASDLDGTLLNPNHQITPFTKKVIQSLISYNNIYFILATGRHYKSTIKICNILKTNSYVITSNGARIHNNQGKIISKHNLNKTIAADLINIVHYDSSIVVNIFNNNEWLTNRKNKLNIKNNFQEKNIPCRTYTKNISSLQEISKIYFSSNNQQKLLSLEKTLYEKWGNKINISFSLPTCLEIMPEGISKGYALIKVVNLLGYTLKDCIAFGDGMNDKEMLAITGKGCIMYNGQQQLKDTLPHLEIIGSNAHNAVSYYLKNLYFC